MLPETLMLYKLIILYILDKVDFPMTNGQLSNILLEKEYTDYFTIQEIISNLVDDEYIDAMTRNNAPMYQITPSGRETLSYFYDKISPAIRDDIDMYLSDHEYSMREEVSTPAEYFEVKTDDYYTRLQILEHGTAIMDISLSAGSKEAAEHICALWKQKSADIYAYIVSSLLSEE